MGENTSIFEDPTPARQLVPDTVTSYARLLWAKRDRTVMLLAFIGGFIVGVAGTIGWALGGVHP